MKKSILIFILFLFPLFCFAYDDTLLISPDEQKKEPSLLSYGKPTTQGNQALMGLGIQIKESKNSVDLLVSQRKSSPFIVAKANYLYFPSTKKLYISSGVGAVTKLKSIFDYTPTTFVEGGIGYQAELKNESRYFIEASAMVLQSSDQKNRTPVGPSISMGIGY